MLLISQGACWITHQVRDTDGGVGIQMGDNRFDSCPGYKNKIMEEDERCPNCGECENIHTNYDWSKPDRPVEEYLCNECGTYFKPKQQEQ